jgi:hypothetical protein
MVLADQEASLCRICDGWWQKKIDGSSNPSPIHHTLLFCVFLKFLHLAAAAPQTSSVIIDVTRVVMLDDQTNVI